MKQKFRKIHGKLVFKSYERKTGEKAQKDIYENKNVKAPEESTYFHALPGTTGYKHIVHNKRTRSVSFSEAYE